MPVRPIVSVLESPASGKEQPSNEGNFELKFSLQPSERVGVGEEACN